MKYSLILTLVFVGFVLYAGIQIPTGITGKTEKNGTGCNCHSVQRDMSVSVTVTGPDTLFKGETGQYLLSLSGGPAIAGGFNVASYLGNLAAVDGTAQLMLSELTHTSPKSFAGGASVSWAFTLTVRDSVYTDTIYSASNSVNGDGFATSADRWNFGDKFVVHVVDQPSSVGNVNIISDNFILDQNYPNPFNPATFISFNLPSDGYVSLKVYDVTGKEIAELMDEYGYAGNNQIQFNANDLTSGVYFYTLIFNNQSQTRKMLLIR